MQIIEGIPVWGEHDEGTLEQIKRAASDDRVVCAALMADGHRGYSVPVGGVVAYEDSISPNAIGFDIGCGNLAVLLDIPASEIRAHIKTIMDDIYFNIAFGVGRKNDTRVDDPLFDSDAWKIDAVAPHKEMARAQLGTVGSGNHFVDLLEDEAGRIWIGVHFGSRGLGHKTATYFLKAGGAVDGMDTMPLVIRANSGLGEDYQVCMNLAGLYAYAGRNWVCAEVARLLGARIVEQVHNHHNYCIAGTEIVPTTCGPKKMLDIKTGDVVYAWSDNGLVESLVRNQWQSGVKPIYTITTGGREIRVSGSHPVLTIDVRSKKHPVRKWHNKRVGNFVWKEAQEIILGDIIVCAEKYYQRDGASIGIKKARLIGAFLGDGWVRHNTKLQGYTVGLAIGGITDAHTALYQKLLEEIYPEGNWRSNTPGAFGLTCSSVDVWHKLDQMGLTEYSGNKRLPAFAFSLPIDEKMALLAGYFDSDGSVGSGTKNAGRGTIGSVSQDLSEGLREIAISCGFQVTPVRKSTMHTNYATTTVYRCVIAPNSIVLLDLWHQKKANNQHASRCSRHHLQAMKIGYLKLADGIYGQKVTNITVSDAEPVYDLEIEDQGHAFVCEGMIVHNCWRENHNGRDLWVIRKGATPAFPGQRSFIGGSMGDNSVIVEGVENENAKYSLYSTVHGAGRVMSRTQARGKINYKTKEVIAPGVVSREMMNTWLKEKNVELRGAGTDESPHCYKRLDEVLAHHADSIKVLHVLQPLGVAMASEREWDPYKD